VSTAWWFCQKDKKLAAKAKSRDLQGGRVFDRRHSDSYLKHRARPKASKKRTAGYEGSEEGREASKGRGITYDVNLEEAKRGGRRKLAEGLRSIQEIFFSPENL